jgi:hypothetical protein
MTSALAGKEPTIAPKDNANPKNHDRYTDSEALTAMGVKNNTNPLNHDRYTDSEAQGAMGVKDDANPYHHDRYTDSEAISALSPHTSDVSAHHTRYTDGEAVTAMGAKADINPLNHDKYEDSDAVSAMGTKDNTNPLNHDRYTDSEAVTAHQMDNALLDGTGGPPPFPILTNKITIFYSGADGATLLLLPDSTLYPPGWTIEIHKQFSAGAGTCTVTPFGPDGINGIPAPHVIPSTTLLMRFVIVAPNMWWAI